MSCLLSIVIPTKNRASYCVNVVKQILSLALPSVEICIQDNSDSNELRESLGLLDANNIVYNYHPGILSFVDNFSEALSLTSGEYICMVGDDDGLLPKIMCLIEEMKKQKADAAIPALNFIYFWPSSQKIVNNGEAGVLISHLNKEYPYAQSRVVNHQHAIKKLLNTGVQNYLTFDIPRLYHGVVHKDVLEKIKRNKGFYFGGLTPDMYMATALALVCQKVIKVQYSVTISGICPNSGSSDAASGKHTGSLEKAPHFRGHTNYEWDDMVPRFYSVDTIWTETLLHALKDFHREDIVEYYNLKLFDGICLKKYPQYGQIIVNHAIENGYNETQLRCSFLAFQAKSFLHKILSKIHCRLHRGIDRKSIREYGLKDVYSVEKAIENQMKFG